MQIIFKLTGGIAQRAGFSHRELDVEPGTTIADLLARFAIDPSWPMIIARNGWAVDGDEVLEPGDRVLIAPVFSGG
ncbi:MAG: MoaD/ThiS family protein [Chloroflexota bacterium]